MTAFRKLAEREVHRGPLISVAIGTFVSADGQEFERDVVHHPGAVSVVALEDDGTVLLVRQYRAALDRELLEIPAGKRDVAGEPPELTAHRELAEEVGRAARRMDLLATFYNSPGFCDEHSYTYLARDLSAVPSDLQGFEEQAMTIERVALDDALGLITSGDITDAKTIIGLTMARHAIAADS